jgi:hypothetical protein
MNKLKRITKNYLWVWNVRNPTLLNKRILQDFIFMYVDAQYEENKMHYYPKYYR